jgi:hypothetical protein
MATEYDLYVATNDSFNTVIRKLEEILDIKFTEGDQPWLSASFSAIGFVIRVTGDLDYEDDMGIEFSKYSYQVSIDTYTRVSVIEYCSKLEYYLTLTIYQRICDKLDWQCMVVEDGQKLIIDNTSQQGLADTVGILF